MVSNGYHSLWYERVPASGNEFMVCCMDNGIAFVVGIVYQIIGGNFNSLDVRTIGKYVSIDSFYT